MFEPLHPGVSVAEVRLTVVLAERRARAHGLGEVAGGVVLDPGIVRVHDLSGAELPPAPPATARLARLLEDGADHLATARAAERQLARAAATRARALAAFARCRPAALLDRAEGEVGAASAASRAGRPAALTAVSEWAVDEVAVGLGMSSSAASTLLVDSVVLVEQLPATLALLDQGRIGWAHVQVLTKLLGPVSEDKRGEVEARVLARVEGKTPAQLGAAARRAIARIDAAAATRRLADALREREVRVYSGEDGMGTLAAVLAGPEARAAYVALEGYAEERRTEGDERTKGQRMADCLLDLILRPGQNGLPPVRVDLTVVASPGTLLGGDEPGEIDGEVIPAAMVRELAYTLGLLPRPEPSHRVPTAEPAAAAEPVPVLVADPVAVADPVVVAEPAPGAAPPVPTTPVCEDAADVSAADVSPAVCADGEAARAALGDLLGTRTLVGTALAARPQIAVVDPLAGTLLALTDAATLRRGEPVGPPPETAGYRPRAALDRFVRQRDRRCRFPGCRARPRKCDLDHQRPWPWGRTTHTNLCCLCEHHHRLSHQAPGWQMYPTGDGGLAWRTPGGEVFVTRPLRFGADDDLPSPEAVPDRAPPATPAALNDPPPF
ncbi:MAG TPA: DUF222 domain-containing protein [Geodermatophilus sp.]|nr:DUF222 domain-containing protein [Geodermatophilus sp.]